MKYSLYRCALALFSAGAALSLLAGDVGAQSMQVHVHQCTEVDGVVTEIADDIRPTGTTCTTERAPAVEGYLFTGWTISTAQQFSPRDRHGRAYDAASFVPFEETTLTAHYLAASVDTDGDGLPDGYEIYWYGSTDASPTSDTDGDGYDLAAEFAAGTNPLLVDTTFGGVVWGDSGEQWYNPHEAGWVTFRCEPEGALFETYSNIVLQGQQVVSHAIDLHERTFAYWRVGGRRMADRNGRALNRVSFEMGNQNLEVIAVCIEDEAERARQYWYGREEPFDSDTDGDGYTFAEELAAGTNPLLPDTAINGGVVWGDSDELVVRSGRTRQVTVRCEPEGELFGTTVEYAVVGETYESQTMDPAGTTFAYWTMNGVRVAGSGGRAVDTVRLVMPDADIELVAHCLADADERARQYWYGYDASPDSDTDGDGYTFAEELAAGTSPVMRDETFGGVVWMDGDSLEVNLQTYEQEEGALLNGTYVAFFTSPRAHSTGMNFGANLTPYVYDFNGDGLFDLVLKSDSGIRFFRNSGSKGAPAFTEIANADVSGLDFGTNDVSRLEGVALNVPLVGALTATYGDVDEDGQTDILVSDDTGRIWYYRNHSTSQPLNFSTFTLQNKVWGGSYNGFANGLRIAAVDWDDDGDVDMLCGTAEGNLMLLSDPRAGHPSNLRAQSGVSDVELTWNATAQSRVRGYNVYRSIASSADFACIAEASLPSYRDAPSILSNAYDYCVTAVSRFYTAGNSRPTVTESTATDPVRVEFGKVRFVWRPAAGFVGDVVDVELAAENAHGLAAENFQLKIAYDENVLVPIEVRRSGLTENLRFQSTYNRGSWIVTGAGGSIESGTGTFLTFSFYVSDQTSLQSTSVTVEDFELRSIGGGNVIPVLDEAAGAVELSENAESGDPTSVPVGSRGDLNGDGHVTDADLELFVRWKDAAADVVPAEIVRAADYNGDGKLDNKDFHLMKKDLRNRQGKQGGSR